jgi:hypothetical protein
MGATLIRETGNRAGMSLSWAVPIFGIAALPIGLHGFSATAFIRSLLLNAGTYFCLRPVGLAGPPHQLHRASK